MKGQYHIIVQNNRVHYAFDVRRNITIIRGDSATGKTTLYQMIDEHTRLGDDSGVEISCEKNCRTIAPADWQSILPGLTEQIIFIDEDSTFIRTQEFAAAIRNSGNYYVLITREDLPNLPYSVEEVYGIHRAGKYHDLRRTYHEFYRLYGGDERGQVIRPDVVVTEDTNSGFEFFQEVCSINGILCVSAGGKSNLISSLRNALKNDEGDIVGIGDGAAIGPEMSNLDLLVKKNRRAHLFLPESFEWLILKSGLIDGKRIQEILDHPEDFVESTRFFSWEQFFTWLLSDETKDTFLRYQKEKLNQTYLHDKERTEILKTIDGLDFTKA